MERSRDVIALGELLVDFTEAGYSANGMRLFEQNPGGAPANLLTVASHMGLRTEFIGKVGADMHGAFLKETLQKEGIGTDHIIEDPDTFTTLAFVALQDNGERVFSFARKPGADTKLRADEIDVSLLEDCKVFHFGSLSLTTDPAKEATMTAVRTAKQAGALISYDPNYRKSLWESKDAAIAGMRSVIPYADVMKVSEEELELLTGNVDYAQAAKDILAMGPSLLAVTMGGDGVLLVTAENREQIPGFTVKAVDTTGAGDSFWGGFLSHYLGYHKDRQELTWEEWKTCAVYGNATAALCVGKRGGIPAIPTKEEVEQFVARNSRDC